MLGLATDIGNLLVLVGGGISAIAVFLHNILTIRKLQLEIDRLRRAREREDETIRRPSLEEIERYGKSLRRFSQPILPMLAILLIVSGILAYQSDNHIESVEEKTITLHKELALTKQEAAVMTMQIAQYQDKMTMQIAQYQDTLKAAMSNRDALKAEILQMRALTQETEAEIEQLKATINVLVTKIKQLEREKKSESNSSE